METKSEKRKLQKQIKRYRRKRQLVIDRIMKKRAEADRVARRQERLKRFGNLVVSTFSYNAQLKLLIVRLKVYGLMALGSLFGYVCSCSRKKFISPKLMSWKENPSIKFQTYRLN